MERRLPAGRDPAFSPRGRRLAFAAGGDLWVVDADGARLRRLTGGPGRDGRPAWSPGGDAVVFASGPAGRRDLYRVRADGTARQQLTFQGRGRHGPCVVVRRSDRLRPPARARAVARRPGRRDHRPAARPDLRPHPGQLHRPGGLAARRRRRRARLVARRHAARFHAPLRRPPGRLRQAPGRPARPPVTPWTWNADAPAWSPDGRRLLVTAAARAPAAACSPSGRTGARGS